MYHNPLTRDLDQKLRKLERFSTMVEEFLNAKSDALGASLSAAAEGSSESQQHDLYEDHALDIVELSDELPTILRFGVLTALHSALEHYMVGTYRLHFIPPLKCPDLDDFRGSRIAQVLRCFKNVAGIDVAMLTSSWLTVENLNKLRNCIVHHDGEYAASDKEVKRLNRAVVGLRISARVISLDETFIEAALLCYRRFADDFDEACKPLGLSTNEFSVLDEDATT